MRIALLMTIYVTECIRYRIGNYVLFQKGMKHIRTRIFFTGMAFCLAISMSGPINDTGKLVVTSFICVIVTFLGMEGKTSVKITQLIWTVLMLTCMDGISGSIIKFSSVQNETIRGYLEYLICDCATLLLMTVLYILVRSKKDFSLKWIDKITRNSVYIGLGITAIGMIFSVAGLNYAKRYISNERFLSVVDEICGMTYLGLCILIYFVIYIRNANNKMQKLLEVERALRKMQINNYRILLQKEEDTRSFRHDIHNHIICLSELLKRGKEEEAKDYLNQVGGKLRAIQKQCYLTGNEVLDAVLNYYIGKVDSDDIKIEVIGACTGTINASEFSLCTIFGNLIENAMEELEKTSVNERYMNIHIKTGRKYVEFLICNSLHLEKKNPGMGGKVHMGIETSKIDKRNHGFGLKNVKETVICCGGDFEYKKENGVFQARVVLPVK